MIIENKNKMNDLVNYLKKAKMSGNLNLSNGQFEKIPDEIFEHNDKSYENQNWWEDNPLKKIDFSINKISELDDKFTVFKDLEVIRGKHNIIKSIPNSIFNINTLKILDLENNKINELNGLIIDCNSLVILNLNSNLLKKLPKNMDFLKNLEILYLKNNKLIEIDESKISNILSLKELHLAENNIEYIGNNFNNHCWEQIDLSYNKIKNIQNNQFNCLKNLKILNIKYNKLSTIDSIPNSDSLEQVIWSNNFINKLNINFEDCKQVKLLDLKNNKLSDLNKSIFNLINLNTLDISNNDLKNLPNELGFMKNLKKIYFEGNIIKSIRNEIKNKGTDFVKKYLRDRIVDNKIDEIDTSSINYFDYLNDNILLLNNMNLDYWNSNILKLSKLSKIHLNNNNFKEIPQILLEIKKLSTISMSNNKIKEINFSFLSKFNLNTLILSKNNIFNFMNDYIKNNMCFENLKLLDLSNNSLKSVPKSVYEIKNLISLNISFNLIYDVDEFIINNFDSKIENLNLSNNKIANLHEDIIYWISHLRTLNLENNEIRSFYEGIGIMNLTSLSILGNPTIILKNSAALKGTSSLLNYLKNKIKDEKSIYDKINNKYNQHNNKIIKEEEVSKNKEINKNTDQIDKIKYEIKIIQDKLDNDFTLNNIKKLNLKKQLNCLKSELNKFN